MKTPQSAAATSREHKVSPERAHVLECRGKFFGRTTGIMGMQTCVTSSLIKPRLLMSPQVSGSVCARRSTPRSDRGESWTQAHSQVLSMSAHRRRNNSWKGTRTCGATAQLLFSRCFCSILTEGIWSSCWTATSTCRGVSGSVCLSISPADCSTCTARASSTETSLPR